jgi:murein L,D-transpeptidase YafK
MSLRLESSANGKQGGMRQRTAVAMRGLIARLLPAMLCATAAASSASALTIELKDVAPDRIERQRAFAMGNLPLPGTPDMSSLDQRLAAKQLKAGDQVFIRIFKAESELEIWMKRAGRFVLLDIYPICHWSGTVGPKVHEGDKQSPEGFYTVGRKQLHLFGRHPRSLDLGFPNSLDQVHNRTGSFILIHGGCSSVGCFAMTNTVTAEVYDLTEKALKAGQAQVGVHVFPFRMTEANLAGYQNNPWIGFWRNLKQGYDAFEQTRMPPRVSICGKNYVVQRTSPSEVGDPGPLAPCGDSRAAMSQASFPSVVPTTQVSTLPVPPAPQLTAPMPASTTANKRSSLSPQDQPPFELNRSPVPQATVSLVTQSLPSPALPLSPDQSLGASPSQPRPQLLPPPYRLGVNQPELQPPQLQNRSSRVVLTKTVVCDQVRASCRKFYSLQNKQAIIAAKPASAFKTARAKN